MRITGGGHMKKKWLKKRATVEEAERKNLITDERLGPDPVLFGFQNDRWLRLKSQMEIGDEIWEFSSPEATWEHLAGRAGLSLVRKGKIVDSIVTTMN